MGRRAVNRAERRRLERQGHTVEQPATRRDAERFVEQAFQDRISWIAARVLLERVRAEGPTIEVNAAIDRFLATHPPAPSAPQATSGNSEPRADGMTGSGTGRGDLGG